MLIAVASCSGYSDAWKPFCHLFNTYWPDCPYRKVLFSDQAEFSHPDFETDWITDKGWNQNLLSFLRRQTDETVLVFQEDFFLCDPARTAVIAEIDEFVRTSDYAMCRLYPCPGADGPVIFGKVGEITANATYRASCQATIWKKSKLEELLERLIAGGHPRIQDFEIMGSRLINDFKLSAWFRDDEHRELWPLPYHCTAICSGKWMAGAIELCRQHGIKLTGRGIAEETSQEQQILERPNA